MPRTTLTFDVRFNVPLKALETLVGLAGDLQCELVTAEPSKKIIRTNKSPLAALARNKPAEFVGSMADAKKLVMERLRNESTPVNRRIIMRDLRAKGFPKNSVGPLCTELKRAGLVTNPRRGYWALPGKTSRINDDLGAGINGE